MITLALDTSTDKGSVAAVEDGRTIFSEQFAAQRSHGSGLFGSLERVRKLFHQPDQIAVGIGPGSYSGTRVAIASAIGLQIATGARLVGIPSVAAMDTEWRSYLAIGDARRETFYFAHVENGNCVEGPRLLTRAELEQKLRDNASLPVFSSTPIGFVVALQVSFPSAERLARLAQQGRGVHATENLEPIYLREPHITQAKKVEDLPRR
jgi:tRNA threonylcarbamoyladenosine biosynthesis protein TsaB